MRGYVVTALCVAVAAVLGVTAQNRTGTLTIYYIDTEGGQSTLAVGPGGESLLVDTGNAGDRDLGRIVETLRAAGVTKIDHLWTTHYHGDSKKSMYLSPALMKRSPYSAVSRRATRLITVLNIRQSRLPRQRSCQHAS